MKINLAPRVHDEEDRVCRVVGREDPRVDPGAVGVGVESARPLENLPMMP